MFIFYLVAAIIFVALLIAFGIHLKRTTALTLWPIKLFYLFIIVWVATVFSLILREERRMNQRVEQVINTQPDSIVFNIDTIYLYNIDGEYYYFQGGNNNNKNKKLVSFTYCNQCR